MVRSFKVCDGPSRMVPSISAKFCEPEIQPYFPSSLVSFSQLCGEMTNPAKQNKRRPRKDCLLTVGERLAIEPFKERYRSEVLRDRRVILVKREIMVAYFNYLDSQKEAPRTPDELKTKTKVRPLFIIM